jgi:radical SAM protein with 4Fe4S-binding SPASM domain
MLNSLREYLLNALAIHRDRRPKYLIFFVTSRCNARCVFCHYRQQIEDAGRKEAELSVAEIEKIARHYGKVSKLSFSGGEPFLREDLPEIIETFVRNCDPRIIDIPTNGSMPERILRMVQMILRLIGDRVLDIQLSIDGPEEVHDRIRGIPGLFRKVLRTYELLSVLRHRAPNLKLKMNLVYFSENREVTASLAREFEATCDFDRFQITYPHGDSVKEGIIDDIDFFEFHRLSKEIQKHYRLRTRKDLHSLIFRAVKMVRDDVLCEGHVLLHDMGAICKAGERILVLDEVGNVYPCEPMWESVGNLRDEDYDIGRILNGFRMEKFREKHLGPGKCTCSWGCVALENIIYTPALYPRLLANLYYLMLLGGRGISNRLAS